MNLNHKTDYQNGDTLSASAWNALASDVNELGAGGSNGSAVGTYLYMNDKGNLCLETTAENTPAGKKGKLNIESNDDIQLKPGDDIMLYGDHRGEGKTDEVSIKVMDGTGSDDVPAKLQVNCSEITLTTKDKTGNNAAVMDINVNSAKNTKGYLKVRAQAIDLRSESHGGIALQPKGYDNPSGTKFDGTSGITSEDIANGNVRYMNKIKFEHGGGDGLEFGTFNTLHTSLFTNDYRFKKDGVIRLSQRYTTTSDKADQNDPTTLNKFQKNNAANNAAISSDTGKTFNAPDDFYDFVETSDPTCTWEDIVKYIHWAKTNNQGPWASNS